METGANAIAGAGEVGTDSIGAVVGTGVGSAATGPGAEAVNWLAMGNAVATEVAGTGTSESGSGSGVTEGVRSPVGVGIAGTELGAGVD